MEEEGWRRNRRRTRRRWRIGWRRRVRRRQMTMIVEVVEVALF